MVGIRFPEKARDLSLLYCVKTNSWAHPGSYPMGTGGSFAGCKAAWEPTTHLLLVQMARMVEPYFHSPTGLYDIVLN
jgi:hypothetical protein